MSAFDAVSTLVVLSPPCWASLATFWCVASPSFLHLFLPNLTIERSLGLKLLPRSRGFIRMCQLWCSPTTGWDFLESAPA